MDAQRIGRRWHLAGGAIAVAATLGALPAVSASSRRATEPPQTVVTVVADVFGGFPSVSADGRLVVFEGRPTDGSERSNTVWLRDRLPNAGADIELTTPLPDVRLGNSVRPAISGDGCVVAVVTEMGYDLFRDDDGSDRWDVYRLVLPECGGQLGDWELVSTQSARDGDIKALDRVVADEAPAISEVGTIIAFTHRARAKDELLAVSVVDVTEVIGAQARTSLVGGTPILAPNTTFRYVGQHQPDVSADGRFVSFTSDAISDAPVSEWGSGPVAGGFATPQVYLWDRQADPLAITPDVTLVSAVPAVPADTADPAGPRVPAVDGAQHSAISGDGRFIAFETTSADLAGDAVLPECAALCPTQIYRFSTIDQSLILVSREATQAGDPFVAAEEGASQPAIVNDGSQVAFVTKSRNLFVIASAAGLEAPDGDIVVSNVDLGVVHRASTQPDGITPAPATSANPAMSASGHVVVFDTLSSGAITGVQGPGRQVAAVVRPPRVTAPPLDMGTVGVGFPGNEWYMSLRNEGPSTFMPSVVVSSNPDFAITGGTCTLGLTVAPGAYCDVKVVLTPSVPGPARGEIVVAEALLGGTSVTMEVLGGGGEPALVPEPLSGLDFPVTTVGQTSSPISTGVANIGFAPTLISRVVVAGDNPDDFDISANNCIRFMINAGSTCSIDVSFVPTDQGYRTATVIIANDLGQYTTVLVNGSGTRVVRLQTATSSIDAGDDLGLGGSGFPANAAVSISWADGRGQSVTTISADDGSFLVLLPTRSNERFGDRVLVAQSGDYVAKATVSVIRRAVANTPGSPVWGP